ncbi:MAG: RNA methyltransferase [Opitutus sp.]
MLPRFGPLKSMDLANISRPWVVKPQHGLPRVSERADHAAVLTKAEIQRLRSLRDKKHRETPGLFVAEGEKVVGELLAAGFPFREIFATGAWKPSAAVPPAVRTTAVTEAEMARISHYPTPSTVLAVGSITRETLQPPTLGRGLTLALDCVQDPGNVGTLLRIADWFAIDRVLLSPDCADLFHQKVINASMGSFARVRTHIVELAEVLAQAPAGVPVLGCELAGNDVHRLPALADAIIVIGSEGRGLSPAVAACVTQRITIPRFGCAESLNAAIAAAIVCDHLRCTKR